MMIIDSIRINKHKYLANLQLDIKEHTQIILGSNMCGKSTLLRLLIPYPINQSQLHPNGSVSLRLISKDKRYLITSAEHYSFKVDGEELNTMGKIGIQKKLCKEHFNIDHNIVDLLLGRVLYTELSGPARRVWSLRLSCIDFEYVNTVQTRVKTQLTYVTNIIKHQTEQLVTIGNIGNIDGKYEEANYLRAYIDELSKYITSGRSNVLALKVELDAVIDRIHSCDAAIRSYVIPKDTIEKHAITLNKIATVEQIQLDLIAKIHECEETANNTITTSAREELERNKLHLETEQQSYKKWSYTQPYNDVQNTCNKISDSLQKYYDLDIDLSLEDLERKLDHAVALRTKHSEYVSALNHAQDYIANMADQSHTCPKCDHIFLSNDTQEERSIKAKALVSTVPDILSKLHSKLMSDDELYEVESHIKGQRWHLSIQHLPYIWDLDTTHGHFKILRDLEEHGKWMELQSRVHQLDIQLGLMSTIDSVEYAKSVAHADDLRMVLSGSNDTHATLLEELAKSTRHLKDIRQLQLYADKYAHAVKQKPVLLQAVLDAIRASSAHTEIACAKEHLGVLDSMLYNYEHKKKEITHLEQSIKKLTKEADTLRTLNTTLSPQAGLIGHTLKGFQSHFVSEVNNYISQVWSETITVYPPDAKLQYKTTCLTDSDDIKETSKGMREIINLAFQLSMQKFVVPDFPLILDEIGVNLDTTHRLKLYEYIKHTLFDDYTNAFIVSHYKELYSLFDTGTEFVVLDRKNIDLSLLPITPNTGLTLT